MTQKVGVLVLARLGVGEERGEITRLLVAPSPSYSLIEFLLSFYNSGNVHLKPKGEIYIHDWLGRQVGSVAINRDASIVLPSSDRLFTTLWQPSQWAVGRYTATVVLYYGNPKLEIRNPIQFWIIPGQRLMIWLGLLFVVGGSLRWLAKYYNHWLVRRSHVS